VDVIDLRQLGFPPLGTVAYHGGGAYPHPAVQELRASVRAADGIVLATPAHHASFSGLLKTGLDHREADAFECRTVGLVANAVGPRGATIACERLRCVVKAMSGWAAPTQAASAPSDFDRETGEFKTDSPRRRCEQIADGLVMFAGALAAAKAKGGAPGLAASAPPQASRRASYHREARDVAVYRLLNLRLARRTCSRHSRAMADATEPRCVVANDRQAGSPGAVLAGADLGRLLIVTVEC
jgi:NAD(P)H-dependent FMN reductase